MASATAPPNVRPRARPRLFESGEHERPSDDPRRAELPCWRPDPQRPLDPDRPFRAAWDFESPPCCRARPGPSLSVWSDPPSRAEPEPEPEPEPGTAPNEDADPHPNAEASDTRDSTCLRLEQMPKEVGVMLMSVGVLGLVLPAVAGSPAMVAGGLVLWPKAFGRVERWLERRFPHVHKESMRQLSRYLDDLDRRYPGPLKGPSDAPDRPS